MQVLEKVVSKKSPLLGWKYCEIAKLAFYMKKCEKSKDYSEKSIEILDIYYDSHNQHLRDLHERYRYVCEIAARSPKE